MTTPTKNPTAREQRLVKLYTDITQALEARGHTVERMGFTLDRVDGVKVRFDGDHLTVGNRSISLLPSPWALLVAAAIERAVRRPS